MDSQCGYRRYKVSLLSGKEFKEDGSLTYLGQELKDRKKLH